MVYVPTKFSLKTANVGKCAIDGFYDDSKVLLSSSQGKHSQIPAKIASVSGHFHHPSLAKPSFTKNDVQTLLWYLKFEARWNKQNMWWRRTTHQGTIISHLGKRNIIVKTALVGDKLIPSRVYIYIYIYIYQISNVDLKTQTNMWGEQLEHSQHDNCFTFSQAHVHSMSGAFINLLIWQTKNHHPCR